MLSKLSITKAITIILLVTFLFISFSYSFTIVRDTKNSNIIFLPDTTINKKLILKDALSISIFYDGKTEVFLESENNNFPVTYFSNSDSTEYLAAYTYHGDSKNQFSVFEVGYCSKLEKSQKSNFIYTKYDSFITENEIYLKMSERELINLKGKDYTLGTNGSKISYTYHLDNNQFPFLKRYRMPAYYAKYIFENEQLIMFKFGFEYP